MVVGAVRRSDPGVEKPQVIENFGGRANRGTGIVGAVFLIDSDRGRESLNAVDIRFIADIEKLTGVGGETFEVTPLALGIKRIESERALSGARGTGDDDQLIPGKLSVHVLQVVSLRSPDDDLLHGSPPLIIQCASAAAAGAACSLCLRIRAFRLSYTGSAPI